MDALQPYWEVCPHLRQTLFTTNRPGYLDLAVPKQVIHDHPEWIAKLRRELFSDINIARAMQTCQKLFA